MSVPRHPLRLASLALALLAGLPVLAGCVARGELVYDERVVYVSGPPLGVYAAPYVYYYDGPAYFFGGYWYYHSPHGWVMFEREPRALYDYRMYGHARGPVRGPIDYRPPPPPSRHGVGPALHAPPSRMAPPHPHPARPGHRR